MPLTYKSTIQEQLIVIDRQPSGRQRVGKAIQSEHNRKQWEIRIEHPNGEVHKATYYGGKYECGVAISDLLNRTENQYARERDRGDRPPPQPYDGNRRVNDGADAPVIPTNRR
jgi:hypothetical protein